VLSSGGRLVSIAEEPPPTEESGVRAVYFVVEPNREQLSELARLVDRQPRSRGEREQPLLGDLGDLTHPHLHLVRQPHRRPLGRCDLDGV
jgi:hypothetical protein